MPVSGEAGKAVTVRALTGTTDETRTWPRAAVLDVSVHTRHGPPGHTGRSPRKSGLGLSTHWETVGGMVYGCRRLSPCVHHAPVFCGCHGQFTCLSRSPCGRTRSGEYPCALAAQVQANGEPPTRVSVAFGDSEEQLRGRNRQETNEPSDEIRCTSLSEFLSRVVNQVCPPHQRFDAGIHVRMSSIPFMAPLLVERESRSLMTRHHRARLEPLEGPVTVYWPAPRWTRCGPDGARAPGARLSVTEIT